MCDAGGICLEPADGAPAPMKNDMSGASAVVAAMLTVRALTAAPTSLVTSGARTTCPGPWHGRPSKREPEPDEADPQRMSWTPTSEQNSCRPE